MTIVEGVVDLDIRFSVYSDKSNSRAVIIKLNTSNWIFATFFTVVCCKNTKKQGLKIIL
ncbi:hypothetical protein [Nostoc sp. C110]|uniref:hypothetical protein n=1 Tax=Nostoc sp. C110 TaxID=3349876 RepID=UPI00370D5085